MSQTQYSPADMDAAVRMAATEAPVSDPIQQVAVTHVALNRSAKSGADLADVINAPKQFTGMGTSLASNLQPTDALYQKTLANISPTLAGQTADPTNGATLYVNPTLQAANGAAQPSWAIPANETARVGPHVFYSGAFPHPAGAPIPPSSELDKIFGVGQSTAQPAPAPAPTPATTLPPQSQLDAAFGVNRPAAPPSGPPMSASDQAAQAQETKNDQAYRAHPAIMTGVNSALLGGLPLMQGAGAFVGNALDQGAASMGLEPKPAYSPGQAFTASRNASQNALTDYAKAHPVASTALNIAGLGLGGVGDLGAKAITTGIEHVAPTVAGSLAGRLATRGAAVGGVGAAYGANTAMSQGAGAPQVAESALGSGVTTAALGGAGEGVGALFGRFAPEATPALRLAAPAAVGAVAGGGLGYALDGKTGAETGAGLGLVAGLGGGKSEAGAVEPTATERATAADLVAGPAQPDASAHTVTAETLDNAQPVATTAEALGPRGASLVKTAAQGGPEATAPLNEALAARGDPNAVIGRVGSDVQAATGIDPATAQMTVADQIAAARAGPAKAAYDAALPGNGVWTPELKALAQEPEVAKAMNDARRLLGSDAMVPNPQAATEEPFPPNMSAAELKARMKSAGALPGGEVTTNDLMTYLKSGGPSVYNVAPAQPEQIPTDQMWDLAKQQLDKQVTHDALGNVEPSSENTLRLKWARDLRGATNDAIPGLADARAISGEYLSNQQAYKNGLALHSGGSNAETSAAFDQRFPDLTPAEQTATQNGYMAGAYSKMERGQTFNPQSLATPFHQAVQQTMFGTDRAGQVQAALAREASLAQSAKAVLSSAKAAPPQAEGHALGGLSGGIVGAAEGGLHGAVRGALAGTVGRGLGGIAKTVAAGRVTPGVRTALGEILAQSPQETARELRLRNSARREVKLSDSGIGRKLAQGALRGVALTGGGHVASALAGR